MFDTTRHTRIFTDEQELHPQTSAHPIGRDEDIQRIANALEPLTRSNPPNNLLIHGPPGSGKTTCVQHVFSHLDKNNITTNYVNCATHTTESAVLTQLLKNQGYLAPKKGNGVDVKFSKLKQHLDNTDIAVALDEFDKLEDLDNLLYNAYQMAADAAGNIGIVLICDKPPTEIDFEPRSMSRINFQELEFEQYSTGDLEEILSARADDAFEDGVVADGVIEEVASYVGHRAEERQGDIRRALNVLRMAGQQAQRDGKSKVTVADVEQVLSENY